MPHSILRKSHFVTALFFLSLFHLFSQSEVDSLRSRLDGARGQQRVDVLNALASRLLTIDIVEAQKTIDESLTLSEEFGYATGKAKAFLVRATLFSQKSRFAEAQTLIQQALDLAQVSDDDQVLANGYLVMGTTLARQNEMETSISYFLKGLDIARQIVDPVLEASFLMNIGRDYELLRNAEKAGEFYSQALEIYQRENAVFRVGQVNINMGVIEYLKGNYGRSIEFNQQALEIFERLGDKAMTALSLQNIGFGHWLLGENEKALEMYDRSMGLREGLNDQYGMGKLFLNRAKVFSSQGRLQATDQAANQALKAANEINNDILKRDIYAFLYDFYRQRQSFEKALDYHEQLARVKETLATKAREDKVAALMAEYEFDQLLAESKLQEQQSRVSELQIQQRNRTIIALILVFVFTMVLFYIQRKRMQVKLQLAEKDRLLLEKEKQVFNTELESQKEHILLKDQILLETRSRLKDLEGKDTVSDHLEELIDKLNHSLSAKDWSRFNLYFGKLYPHFFEKLGQEYTDTTQNDHRLAAMIKINFTNKEVAGTLNISPESVIRAKHRLRNKMGFDTTRQMEDFIQQL